MKKIKKVWSGIHEDDRFYIVLVLIMLVFAVVFMPVMCKAQPRPALKWEKVGDNHWVVKKDTTAVKAAKVTIIGIVTWTDGKNYTLYKGAKGGIYIIINKKDGTSYKRYLTKKEREKLGL